MRELLSRRTLIGGAAAAGALWLVGGQLRSRPAAAGNFEVQRTPEEWRRRLSPAQFSVLRQGATERAGSSPLNREKRRGIYRCAGCGLPLFRSTAKYESGTGWPSFTAAIPGAVGTKRDDTLFMRRTEVHCRRCGGHLGHVFDDGPPPTGKRWCMNGAALQFVPA